MKHLKTTVNRTSHTFYPIAGNAISPFIKVGPKFSIVSFSIIPKLYLEIFSPASLLLAELIPEILDLIAAETKAVKTFTRYNWVRNKNKVI